MIWLFDIDGTLLSSGGAGQTAMELTLQEEFGLSLADYQIPVAGRTDRAIVSELLAFHGLEIQEKIWTRFQKAYFERLPSAMDNGNARVLPGVLTLLERLSNIHPQGMGVLSGNFAQGALIKLAHFGLDRFFCFGSYGDDHHLRDDLARHAWQSVVVPAWPMAIPQHVWIIGDTPADVQCARAIGANVVAVATGMYSLSELAKSQPDLLVENLNDASLIIETLISSPV